MRILYFASVREAIGRDDESWDFPAEVTRIDEAVNWLSQRSPAHLAAFTRRDRLRFALDQKMVTTDAPLAGAQELAIFPPVTGG